MGVLETGVLLLLSGSVSGVQLFLTVQCACCVIAQSQLTVGDRMQCMVDFSFS